MIGPGSDNYKQLKSHIYKKKTRNPEMDLYKRNLNFAENRDLWVEGKPFFLQLLSRGLDELPPVYCYANSLSTFL